jgi:diphosphomevalonate decarboxylase
MKALEMLHKIWDEKGDGPLVTMDAGSNVHLLYREDQGEIYNEVLRIFRHEMPVWTDEGYLNKL